MTPNPESEWWVTTKSAVIAAGAEDAVLVLRLGLAVNALRAQHRFSDAVNDSKGPGGARDRLWAFIQAVAYVREGLNILSGTSPTPAQSQRVKELAEIGGAEPRHLSKGIIVTVEASFQAAKAASSESVRISVSS